MFEGFFGGKKNKVPADRMAMATGEGKDALRKQIADLETHIEGMKAAGSVDRHTNDQQDVAMYEQRLAALKAKLGE